MKPISAGAIVAATILTAGCGGGGGGGNTASGPLPVVKPLLLTQLPTVGTWRNVAAAQVATAFIGGSVPASGSYPGYTFDFSTAALSQTSSTGTDLGLRLGGPTGSSPQLTAQFHDWDTFDEMEPGLVASSSTSASFSNVSAADYPRPAGATLSALFFDGTGTAALSFMGFGYWAVYDDYGAAGEQFVAQGGGAIGSVSPNLSTIASLPATATYRGVTIGAMVLDGDPLAMLGGSIRLNANFGTGQMDAAISNIKLYDGTTVTPGLLPAGITFANATIDRPTASFAGSTSGTMTATFDGVAPNGGATLTGQFYGPVAQEAGGTWAISGTNLGPAGNLEVSGSFGAVR
ncbi:transferrin-binding protein-like solute binding protein [Zavarzinia sp.]|uniref:transferrin-binding protein-like solute binding protein n=1 Tax=Zavarzinia sp. TaxID=2027920 RepID=UPI003564266B